MMFSQTKTHLNRAVLFEDNYVRCRW